MQTSNRFLDDLARLANGMLGVAAGFRGEIEGVMKARLQAMLADANLVPREEFEAMRDLAVKARHEQEELRAKIAALEVRLAVFEAGSKAEPSAGPARRPSLGLPQ